MPRRILWTPEMDATIIRMRGAGFSWQAIEAVVLHSHWSVAERGRLIGAVAPVVEEEPEAEIRSPDPLPPGDPISWGAITQGTSLEGARYG